MRKLRALNSGDEAAGHSLIVLIADGDPTSRGLLELAVESWGCRPLGATDGEEALELYRRLKPDVVILDLDLPKVDGHGVLLGIRSLDPHATVVLVSGSGSLGDAKLAMREGAADFLTKPLDYARLKDLVQTAMHGRHAVSACASRVAY